ncbi:CLNK protein, partial [Psilopogon haemacephalus]|nr:CLNK protein [Psilopogon haemacephalus]
RPLKTLPKQYQPLPPEPQISSQIPETRKALSQAHTFPVSAKATRYGCVLHPPSPRTKTFSPVKPQNLTSITPLLLLKAKKKKKSYSLDSWSTLNAENLSVMRSSCTARKNKSKPSLVKQEMQSLTQATEQDLNNYEWYIGGYDRHKAEQALLQENIDETFLVRDCSKKSNAEPYVLVVYYGQKVYNIQVRFLEESQQYTLGTGLRGEDVSKIRTLPLLLL